MKRKVEMLVIVSCSAFLLGACQKNKETSHSTKIESSSSFVQKKMTDTSTTTKNSTKTNETTSQSSEHMEKTSSSPEESPIVVRDNTLWNEDKTNRLREFMGTFGGAMNQVYKEYTPENNVNYYGVEVPRRLLDDIPMMINEEKVISTWSANGIGGPEYHIVATYADVETATNNEFHCYVFAIHQGQPVVLIGQSEGYFEYRAVVFKETENQDLKNEFAMLVQEKAKQAVPKNALVIEPMKYDEVINLITQQNDIPFSSDLVGIVREGTYPFTKGGYCITGKDGSMTLRMYSGSRGFEEYTVTPQLDNKARVVWTTSTIEKGKRIGVGVAVDRVVER